MNETYQLLLCGGYVNLLDKNINEYGTYCTSLRTFVRKQKERKLSLYKREQNLSIIINPFETCQTCDILNWQQDKKIETTMVM
jgi:hypothetical protein